MKSEAKICASKSFLMRKLTTRMMSGGLNIVLDENFYMSTDSLYEFILFIYILVLNEL